MKVYSLLGFVDWELGFVDWKGSQLLGVFGSLEDLMKFVESERQHCSHYRSESLGYDQLGYVVSDLGSKIDVLGDVEYL